MVECQQYFWILKSYQHGTRIGGERDPRPQHITAWTWHISEEFCMRLRSSACVRVRSSSSACVRLRPCARVCVQNRTRLDANGLCVQTRLLFKDFRYVLYIPFLGLWGRRITRTLGSFHAALAINALLQLTTFFFFFFFLFFYESSTQLMIQHTHALHVIQQQQQPKNV